MEKKKLRVVFVSTMLPSGHYSQILTEKLSKQREIELIIYTDQNQENLKLKNYGTIKPVWSKSLKFGWEILRELKKDKPDIVHLQHEINMYGSPLTAVLFPFLILILRILGYHTVVTIHSVVPQKEVDKDFIPLFNMESVLVRPFTLKLFFKFIYIIMARFANAIVVHTQIMKDALKDDYKTNPKKVFVIPPAVPEIKKIKKTRQNYFFYFGYMVRRKGLGFVLDGFKKYLTKNPNSKFKFILAGGVIKGQEKSRDEIAQDVKNKQLTGRVIMKGFIEDREQNQLYANAYAIIMPAKISIAASGPLYHAYSHEKCPIASDVGNFREEIIADKTGILIENNNWDKAFQFAVEHENIIANIEKNIGKIKQARSPLATARKYAEIYLRTCKKEMK